MTTHEAGGLLSQVQSSDSCLDSSSYIHQLMLRVMTLAFRKETCLVTTHEAGGLLS